MQSSVQTSAKTEIQTFENRKNTEVAPTGDNNPRPEVYFTSDISPEGLSEVYNALGRKAEGKNVAVKLHTGEGTESNLDYGQEIGLGSKDYKLVDLDD